ncbi:beta strand repeat-containing protein [Yoonia sp. R2331]|uniref:beta strand repeat-containing protein n=1 Tax=Yoonia sp. R2331 TaxID=3237238 RepID=UPI0034E4907E
MTAAVALGLIANATPATATPFTSTVPGSGVALPPEYPEAGGVAIVLTGSNGNIYYQFSNPAGAFRGFQNNGTPSQFRGNPFTINDPIGLDCGFRSCTDYFGGSIAQIDVRFTAYDGDTQVGGFDRNNIELVMNGFDVGNWSGLTTEITNTNGTQSFGFQDGFGNNTTNTGWFSSNNPALLANILATGQTTTQVRDRTPNDNYWDFRRGENLPNNDIRTIAPGYELTKVRRGGDTTYLTVGQVITYDYEVANIGSVNISNITVDDDKIGSVTCTPTFLPRTESGQPAPATALCSATYTVTQEDIDNGTLTNVAVANGTPEFGQLGQLQAQVVLTGPALAPAMDVDKVASPTSFTTAGQVISYTVTVSNTGNATLSNVQVTDPLIPALTCDATEVAPLSADNTDNTITCTGTYVVTQTDVDNAAAGTSLVNTATARARDPNNQSLSDTGSATVTGPASAPAMELTKTAGTANYDAVGDVLNYDIAIRNTGNVTWPGPPTVTDTLDPSVSCPAGAVAPGNTVTCSASYTVMQSDIDAGEVLNTASATITVSGATAMDDDDATIPAVFLPALTVEKSLASGADPFTATTDQLVYSYLLTNTGNVRLDAVDLSDDKITLTCPAATIPAGGNITCTSDPYTITQDDLDAGEVTNTATAEAETPDGTAITPVTDDLTVDADQMPALSMAKSGSFDGSFLTNETISYSYLVTNTGNVELPGPFTVDDNKFSPTVISCPAGALAPGDDVTCTATYTITTADVSAGFVNNTATAATAFGGDPVVSNADSVSLSPTGTPSLDIAKAADLASFSTLGETITYTYTVTNDGTLDIDLTGVDPTTIVSDDKIPAGGVDCSDPNPLPAALTIGNSLTCTGTYDVTQPDIDAGEVVNMATATLSVSGTDVTSPAVTETVPSAVTPGLTLDKATATADFGDLGDTIDYTFSVTNTSAQTISTVDISDPLLGGAVCAVGPIAPFGTESCAGTYSYTIMQADLDRGFVTNTATALGRTPGGAPLTDTDGETVNADGTVLPSLDVDKRASATTFAAVGDRIDYVIDVLNDGKITLTDVVVTDAQLGLSCSLPAIAPGDTDSSCVGSYTITQDDIDAGSYVNTAFAASAANGLNENDMNTVTGPAADPSVEVTKVADGGFALENDVVTFTLTARNTGNVTLTGVTITDADVTFAPACAPQDLAPGASYACTGTYTVQQSDVDAGEFSNTGDVTGNPPSGPAETDSATVIVPGPAEMPGVSVSKTIAGNPSAFALGDTLTYNFSVTNTGNVTLTGLTIDDPDPRITLNCALDDLAPGATATTCAGGAPALSADLTITQDEVDFGAVVNTVNVTGVTTEGTPVDASDENTIPGPDQTPELSIVKSSPTGGFSAVGDTITYNYVVTNVAAGNPGAITITEPITVDDDRTPVVCDPIGAGLAPGDSLNCTASYTVTQDDLDTGDVTNVAFAEVTQPVVPSATHPDGSADVASPTDTVTVNATQGASIEIDKVVTPGTPSTYAAVGDTVSYTFTVRNTGNVTLTAPFTVNDPDIDPALSCGSGAVAPGGAVTCTAIWTAQQSDIDAGSFTNSATAATTFGGAPVTTPTPASVTVNAVQTPAMEVEKELTNILGNGGFNTSSTLEYTYQITNTGNQTIVGPIEITDNLIGTFTCFAGDLDPTDAPVSCTATYPISSDDVAFGSVTNTAFASSPTVDSPPTSETVPEGEPPTITITKTPDVTSFDEIGDTITYTFDVTNTSPGGALAPSIAREIVIRDDNFPGMDIACFDPAVDVAPAGPSDDLDPGETFTCTETVTYIIDQDDLDRVQAGLTTGFVTNNAAGIVTTIPSGSAEISSPPVQVTVEGVADNLLTVDKSVTAGNNPAAVGDMLTYQITVDNDGNQTISGLAISDPLIPGLSCLYNGAASPTTLQPGQQAVCTGSYTVQQADLDAGTTLDNIADVAGNTPQGVAVTGMDDNMHPLVTPDPEVTILKELAQGEPMTAFSAVGQQVPYQITVTNSGNITLTSTTVTDILFPGEQCDIGPLAPGQQDTSCVFTYTVTQDDIDRGTLDNEATATSTTDNYGPVDDSDDITGSGPAREPAITITKEALDTTFANDGDTLDYRYVIANTGNVTLTAATTVTDDLIPSLSCGNSLPDTGPAPDFDPVLLPDSFFVCTGTYTVDQDDVNAGEVTNIATAEVADPVNGGTIDDDATVTVSGSRNPDFTISKVASDTTNVAEGDTITYTYTVANTGNVTLTAITLTDAHTSASGTANLTISSGGVIASLDPTDTAQLTATYVVTQADIDAGNDLTNIVSADATPPAGVTPPPTETATETVDLEDPDPSLETVKTVTPPATLVAGQTVVFDISVSNTGNVTLDNVSLSDTLSRADGTPITPSVPSFTGGDTGGDGLLGLTEVWTYQLTHVLTQDDIDAGGLSNTATASAEDPFGTPVDDVSHPTPGGGSTPTTLPIAPMPDIEGEKVITAGPTTLNGIVRFEITATNTGNVTLTGVGVPQDTLRRADGTPLTLTTDPTFFAADAGSGEGTLIPGETATFRATYQLTQDDIDAGGIDNRARVAGTDPNGTDVDDLTDAGTPGDNSDRTVLTIPAAPALSLVKELTAGGPTFDAVGDTLTYTFTVTNDGNVTITDPISITDPLITNAGGTITCGAVPLAPDASLTCTGSYTVDQDDLNAGQVDNTATASDGTTTSPVATESVPAQQAPAVTVDKTAVSISTGDNDVDNPANFVSGAVISFEYTVRNTGNVNLTGPLVVNDNLIPGGTSCPANPNPGMAPGDELTCTASYTVVQPDVDVGSATNTATATVDGTTSPPDSVTVPTGAAPGLTVTKTLVRIENPDTSVQPGLEFDEVNDVLVYEFEVTNTGDAAFTRDIVINDPLLTAPVTCWVPNPGGGDPDFTPANAVDPAETATCEGQLLIDQDDLDSGSVTNSATAETSFGPLPGTPVISPPSVETTDADIDPSLSIAKTADLTDFSTVGQMITYTLTVTNDGNQTISGVRARDDLLPLDCTLGDLLPGDVDATCTGTYAVTQDDIDNGNIPNDAFVTGIDPQGDPVRDDTSLTVGGPTAAPDYTLTKSATPDPFGAVGTGVTYTFTVENTGNVTLTDLTITDDIVSPAYTCDIARLDVGATDATCTLSYTVTQDDKDAGEIQNTATATAMDPSGTPVDRDDTITTPAVPAMPGLEVTKTSSAPNTFLGTDVTYTLQLVNTGDVTLDIDSITDTMTRRNFAATPTTLTTPFGSLTGDTDGDGRLDVTEVWTYTGTKRITQADIDAGGFDNTVLVAATDPFGTPVNETSDDGDDTDGNTDDDPTEFAIVPGPALSLVKTITTTGAVAGDEVVFALVATNQGNTTLFGIDVSDTLTDANGTVLSTAAPTIVNPTSLPGSIAPGQVLTFELRYTLTQDDVDAGGISNTATVTATAPNGDPVDDVSDDGDNTDGNTSDDPTVLSITPAPALEVTKLAVPFADPDAAVVAGDVVEFTITAENTGTVTLTNLVITDTLTNLDGDALTPDSITFDSGTDETSLIPGAINTFTVLYTLTQADIDSGGVENTALAETTDPSGDPVTDTSDNGIDDDGNTTDDPTVIAINQIASIEATKEATTPELIGANLYRVTFDVTVTNTGNITQTEVQVTDDLVAFTTPAELIGTTTPTASGWIGTGGPNPGFDGRNDINLLTSGVSLAPGATGTLQFDVDYDTSQGFPGQANVVSVVSSTISEAVTASVEIPRVAAPDIFATKSVAPETVLRGGTVTYTLTFQNRLAQEEAQLTAVDIMPAGVIYTPGTSAFDGVAIDDPETVGNQLRWSPLTLAPLGTSSVTFDARVVGDAVEMVNRAYMLGPDGEVVSNIATATLTRPPEPVFECADIIGKVFDDENFNGYQDGVVEPDRSQITDQTYYGGKGGGKLAPEVLTPGAEPGLPNVRLSTVNGTLITTDAYGRFSVPCAELPASIGSNFTLKLDERTLPTGYAVTTENPRTIRVTPGTVAKLNFGAALGNVVDIDLMAAAFGSGAAPSAALASGIDNLAQQVGDSPVVLNLNYYVNGEGRELARARLDAAEALIRDRWRGAGLRIVRAIRAVQ